MFNLLFVQYLNVIFLIGKDIYNLVEKWTNVNVKNNHIIILTSMNGHIDIIRYLTKSDIDVHMNMTVVHDICFQNRHIEVVKYLVENGSNVHSYK